MFQFFLLVLVLVLDFSFSITRTMRTTRTISKTKKPRLMARRGDKTVVLLLIFPKPMMLELELAPVIET